MSTEIKAAQRLAALAKPCFELNAISSMQATPTHGHDMSNFASKHHDAPVLTDRLASSGERVPVSIEIEHTEQQTRKIRWEIGDLVVLGS